MKAARNRPPEVVGLADGGGVRGGMHLRLHVPRRRTAGYGRGHQKPHQAAEHRNGRDDEWRIKKEIVAKRVGEDVLSREEESECDQDREKTARSRDGVPGRRTRSENSPGPS